MNRVIKWRAYEYAQKKRTPDWYFAFAIIIVALVVTSFIYKNILFAIFIILGTLTLLMYTARKPKLTHFEIQEKGILIENTFYPYEKLKSFFIRKKQSESYLILESNALIAPHITIPLSKKVTEDEVYEFLSRHLKEEEHTESVSEIIMDKLGF